MSEFYRRLGVGTTADFAELKRAYYALAKRCHPDTDPDNPALEERFKALAEAFETLSDPVKRAVYDARHQILEEPRAVPPGMGFISPEQPILDTEANDLLEEWVTGNPFPRDTTLLTFFRDLQSTRVFILFREAKNALWDNDLPRAFNLLLEAVHHSPANILYHYYLARTALKLGKKSMAKHHFESALALGKYRDPPLKLPRIEAEYRLFRESLNPFKRTWRKWFGKKNEEIFLTPPEELMRRELERCLERNLRERRAHDRPRLTE